MLRQPRTTQRYVPRQANDERLLTERIVDLAREYGRYGYRRVTALLRMEGWSVNHKRVQRIWRLEGLRVPKKQPKRARLWLSDGSCVRLRPQHKDHVWAYDFVHHRTHDGRSMRLLTIVDEYTLQRQVTRRAAGQRDLLHAQGGTSADREMAETLQPGATAQLAGLSTTGTGSSGIEAGYASLRRLQWKLVSTDLLR